MFVFSLIPYLSIFTADYPNSLLPQVLYGLDFIIVDIILFVMARSLVALNSENVYLKEALNVKNALVVPFTLFIIGFLIAFMGYPIAISVCCLITIVRSLIYSIKD